MKYFLLAFLFCPSAFAWEMTFELHSNVGARAVDTASEKKGEYNFGGKNLGKSLPPNILKAWKELAQGPTPPSKKITCSMGTFTFTKKDSKSQVIKGCMQGAEYGRYIGQLETVRSFARGL